MDPTATLAGAIIIGLCIVYVIRKKPRVIVKDCPLDHSPLAPPTCPEKVEPADPLTEVRNALKAGQARVIGASGKAHR